MVAQMDPNKNAGDFWFALGIPPRPAFYLVATIAMDLDLKSKGRWSLHGQQSSNPTGWGKRTGCRSAAGLRARGRASPMRS